MTHNAKYSHGSSGTTTTAHNTSKRKNAYCPRVIPEDVTHEYILLNLLFNAERAWAQACAAQAAQNHGAAQRRFNKAVKWAQQLHDILQRCAVEASTMQEGEAYLAWMQGNKALESKNYATAFRQYSASRTTLLALAKGTNIEKGDGDNDVDKLTLSDLWTTRADTVLLPLIRFCQYEAKDELDPAEVAQSLGSHTATDSKNKSSSGMSLEFRNQTVDLEAYPQLAVLYLKMEQVLEDIQAQKEEKVFLQLLADLDDALSIVATESSRYEALPAGPAVTAKRLQLATLKSFFTYHKLQLQRKHQEDTLLLSDDNQDGDDADLFHFYDALLQNAQAVADLAAASDEEKHHDDDYNPEDDPHWLEAQAHVVRIRAIRCFHLACLYETVLNGTTAQVLALLQQARVLQRRAAEEVAACEMDDSYLEGLEELKTKIRIRQCRVEASRYLELVGASAGIKMTHRPLWQRIHDLDAGPVLADDLPVLIPLPCKPTFYDLAGTCIAESVTTEALDAYIQENEPQKSTSKGLFGGWFS